ncbi:MAG: MBL fold metallo-hydrolase [Micavibrio aeruginosavorus]|uniref:MBL fold metallo-hydrolase n=1 Tax=Micavibrio aeruginosavorus TaxID=349221 RepID=A0A2W5N2U1_9BACT|nr:MAG: MBL fold metallo-hydrolase [Micavibrio aeruginosavorus]
MIDRRNFMIGSGLVAGGMLLKPSLGIDSAMAAQTGSQVPGFYRTNVGSIQVTALLDGTTEFSDDLFTSVGGKEEDLKASKEKNFFDAGKPFPGFVNGFLVNTGSRLTLIDTGARGAMPKAGKLVDNLAAAGVSPDDIDEIIITHAHPDHAGGLLDDKGMRVFPKSSVRISREDLDFWFDAEQKAKFPQKAQLFDMAQKLLSPYRNSGQIETFPMGNDLGKGLSSVSLPGHTPGHSGIRISDGAEQLLIWADIVHLPAVQFENPQQSIGYDIDPDQARKTRAKIFDEVATDKIRVGGMHLCFPAIGHVAKRGSGYEFVPQIFEDV